ncbi:coenzyme Q biosynthesis Coq4 [Neoconidiobolus thromboides FSU 785]|nr:coenzyme Q biosynthesis Coq4 [Neoconidiobolus thromboides FSU 785]
MQPTRLIKQILYPGHQPLSSFEKLRLAVSAGFQVLKDPTRQDLVAALGETTGTLSLQYMRNKMIHDKIGRRLLFEKREINSNNLNLERLKLLPEGTFGREYIRFLEDNQVSPDTRTEVHYVDDPELAYVMLRYRQVHDFLHTLCNMGITVEEELALKWFELAQFKLPMNLLSVAIGPVILGSKERKQLFESKLISWAIQCGSNSKFLLNVPFEDLFDRDLVMLRKELGIFLPPQKL